MNAIGLYSYRVSYPSLVEYEIVHAPDLLDPSNPALLSLGRGEGSRRFVVVDENVYRYYGKAIHAYFEAHGIEARIVPVPAGEEHKNLETYLFLARELDAFPLHRRDEPIIAIGGGVLTDVVGFLASTYRRGLPHIKVPTTLMGYVDASIGIKTGFNFNGNKNRLGSFYAPQKVLLDKTFFRTLPRRHLLNGVCEIIKLAVIKDIALFEMLESWGRQSVDDYFQGPYGDLILDRAIRDMIEELEPNLFEEELARKVDFGHTFSYGLEARYEGQLYHGEAVLLDILLSTLIARARSLLTEEEKERVFRLTESLGIVLDGNLLLDPQILWESLVE
ncbi:MAG: sedoheptulose 7-phosphate cyclase, partial [Anaerolineales bacterium]